jgi:hypothetical protein
MNTKTGETKPPNSIPQPSKTRLQWRHIIEPRIRNYFPKNVFSIIDLYLSVMNKEKIFGYLHDNTEWKDYGEN